MSIKVSNLIKQYGEQKAVNNISFTINKGEIVGFLGPNGAGKSTTMKMITDTCHRTMATLKFRIYVSATIHWKPKERSAISLKQILCTPKCM
jgi:ABC-2 type transport system ATP-binding protein